MMETVIIIPARYGSSRLPGKPLADIHGKPMIQWVLEKAQSVSAVSRVVVATDDERVAGAVESCGGEAVLTSSSHQSGTERMIEVMHSQGIEADLFINVQGDEPLLRPADIERLIAGMRSDPNLDAGTLYHAIDESEAADPNAVKVVLGAEGNALYFSRSAIPYPRRQEYHPGYRKHVGIYAYRKHVLERYLDLPASSLEQVEQLEQLRLLSAGISLRAFEVGQTGPGVDTPESLAEVRRILAVNDDATALQHAGYDVESEAGVNNGQ